MRGDDPVKSQPWDELVAHFRELVGRQPEARADALIVLLEHLRTAPLGSALHGATVHDQLLLSPLGVFGFEGEVLQLEADPADGAVILRYASAAGGPRWHRRAVAPDAVAAVERFVDELHWIG